MTNNTIPNVPRDLPTPYELATHEGRKLDESRSDGYCGSCSIETHIAQLKDPKSWVHSYIKVWEKLGGLYAEDAPSPAGVDWPVRNFKTREGYDVWDKLCTIPKFGFLIGPIGGVVKVADIGNWIDRDEAQSVVDEAQCEVNLLRHEASNAQAIIDGLRGEVASQEETANQWRELALQFDRHRITAMAHIRAAASGDKSAIEALGVFAALPPIPGHEITAAHERKAQRIGELAELAAQASVNCKNTAYYLRKYRPDLADICSGWCVAIDAALSAGKDGE